MNHLIYVDDISIVLSSRKQLRSGQKRTEAVSELTIDTFPHKVTIKLDPIQNDISLIRGKIRCKLKA